MIEMGTQVICNNSDYADVFTNCIGVITFRTVSNEQIYDTYVVEYTTPDGIACRKIPEDQLEVIDETPDDVNDPTVRISRLDFQIEAFRAAMITIYEQTKDQNIDEIELLSISDVVNATMNKLEAILFEDDYDG